MIALTDEQRDAIDARDRAAVRARTEELMDLFGVTRTRASVAALYRVNEIRILLLGLPPLEWPPE